MLYTIRFFSIILVIKVKKMKSALIFWLAGLLALFFGIFTILEPTVVLNVACIVFSLLLAFRGLKRICDAIRFKKNALKVVVDGAPIDLGIQKGLRMTLLWDGIGSLVIAIAAFVLTVVSIDKGGEGTMKGIVYAVAAGFLYTGCANLIESHRLKPYPLLRETFRSNSLVFIVAAVLLFAFPFFIGQTVMNIFGIILIISGVSLFVWGIRIFSLSRRMAKTVSYKEVK